ncbi:hypothetical protein ACTZWT_08595 [Rhodopseudomonas sp. NSM]|uniref:hypothetical protein n=1 Tax=Rhodopseudomonas sp. NSM TaxID=3457630 RepID=UPI00403697D4
MALTDRNPRKTTGLAALATRAGDLAGPPGAANIRRKVVESDELRRRARSRSNNQAAVQ